MKPQQLIVLGVAAVIAAFIIGLTNPTLIDGSSDSDTATCGAAWSGSASNVTESGESDCAQIRSGRVSWSVTLAVLGAGLIVCALVGGDRKPQGPIVNPAPEFGQRPPPPAPVQDPPAPA